MVLQRGVIEMAANAFGIDLGTSNIKIYNREEDSIFNERNMIAIEKRKKVIAIGDEAFDMYERAPESIDIFSPMRNGVIADINNMQILLNGMLKKSAKKGIRNSDYYIAVPTDITEVERRAFYHLIYNSDVKAKNVYVVEQSVADALGLGLDVTHAKGVMIVNIGADTTEISIISIGGIVLSKLIKTGGNKFDQSIISSVKREHNLVIGSKTAEYLKMELASALSGMEMTAKVYGRDVVTGLPKEIEISSGLIYEAIEEQLRSIVDAIKITLERTPPELAADIIDSGIYLTGGSSNIRSFDELIEKETDLNVNFFKDASESVARGLAKIINEDDFRDLAYSMKDKPNY